jgi:hypothetical protein
MGSGELQPAESASQSRFTSFVGDLKEPLIAAAAFLVIASLGVLLWSIQDLYSQGVQRSNNVTNLPPVDNVAWFWLIGSFAVLLASSVAFSVLRDRRYRQGERAGAGMTNRTEHLPGRGSR